MQFEDFSLSMESLFCILIGDDLFTTFEMAHTNSQSYAVKFFSEFYLILFIFIFIYAVLSLFIGIFNHAYESLSVNSQLFDYKCINISASSCVVICQTSICTKQLACQIKQLHSWSWQPEQVAMVAILLSQLLCNIAIYCM